MKMISGRILSDHAWKRMNSRGIALQAIETALEWGRSVYTRGALIYYLGRRETKYRRQNGIDISKWNGIQVVCSADEKAILTVYKNKKFKFAV